MTAFELRYREHNCMCGAPCGRALQEKVEALEHEVATLREHLDPNVESLADVVLRLEDRIAELDRLLAARREHCRRVHGCGEEVS